MKNRSLSLIARHSSVAVACLVFTLSVSSFGNPAVAESCVPTSTAPGSLDSCFGFSGKVTTSLSGTTISSANDVVLQTDGKIVVAVGVFTSKGQGQEFYVLRYDSSGLLDPTFASGGVARISFAKTGNHWANALAIQPDGKIIVVGYAPVKSYSAFAVARLNANGSLDTTFGNGGKILFTFQNHQPEGATGVTVQANGYIVVAGRANAEFALARFTPNGAFDLGFNGTGKITVSTANSTDTLVGGAYAVTIQKVTVSGVIQEKLVAVGIRPRLAIVDRDMAVLRFNPNGSLDSSFGIGGKVFTNFTGYSDQAKAVAIDANNKIVVAGHTLTSSVRGDQRFALVRYTENGELDTSFGLGGRVTAGIIGYSNALYGHGLAIQADGRIAVSGYVETVDFTSADFAVARFNAEGAPDAGFGSDGTGIVLTDFYGGKDYAWGGLALQTDGRIVVVGEGNSNQISLARYMP